jgi:sulfate adenylyltransferase subunit 1
VVFHVADDVDISRGDIFATEEQLPAVEKDLEVLLCWLDQKALQPGNKYLLQQNSRLIRAVVKEIDYKIDVITPGES